MARYLPEPTDAEMEQLMARINAYADEGPCECRLAHGRDGYAYVTYWVRCARHGGE